eukprot:9488342-Pyramimonas_sp.AAC.1
MPPPDGVARNMRDLVMQRVVNVENSRPHFKHTDYAKGILREEATAPPPDRDYQNLANSQKVRMRATAGGRFCDWRCLLVLGE